MYRYDITERDQINDFLMRYERIQNDIKELEERVDESKEAYRKLKKISYHASLAENAQYCYGPTYTFEQAYAQTEAIRQQIEKKEQHLQSKIDKNQKNNNADKLERGEKLKKN